MLVDLVSHLILIKIDRFRLLIYHLFVILQCKNEEKNISSVVLSLLFLLHDITVFGCC